MIYAGMTSLTYRAVYLVYTACRPYAWQIRRRRTHCAYTQQADISHDEQARAPITNNKGEIELAHTRAHYAIRHPSRQKRPEPKNIYRRP